MNYLVTGAAGFIGYNICLRLLQDGNRVVGVDNFSEVLYPKTRKKVNISELKMFENFTFHELDLSKRDAYSVLDLIYPDVIINQAGLPGQGTSWLQLEEYLDSNTLAVSLLSEWAVNQSVRKFVQASTSSVYGDIAIGSEDLLIQPVSPYGVTKAAAELLLNANLMNSGTAFNVVRYFSVYGPRQRPDMGIYKFIQAAIDNQEISVYGDGSQSRDFTFIEDVVDATLKVAASKERGRTYNVSGGNPVTVNELLEELATLVGSLKINHVQAPRGDQIHTRADTTRIFTDLGWKSKINLCEGLEAQVNWQQALNLSAKS